MNGAEELPITSPYSLFSITITARWEPLAFASNAAGFAAGVSERDDPHPVATSARHSNVWAAMSIGLRGAAWRSRVRASTLAIVLITGLAAVLRLVSLADVPANPYYDAAVRSMGQSWHNFVFAAFEPSARLGLDKPPVDLWFQVASVKLFGFHSFALKLPEALAGTAAVVLVYDLVRRVFGSAAGLAS